jgi:hypothetical protein
MPRIDCMLFKICAIYSNLIQPRRPAAMTPMQNTSSRHVTRASESSKQSQIQEVRSTRRTSSRLASNSLKGASSASQIRKSKATQISLGVGRPKVAGGSGARAVTRSSTSSVKPRKVSRGKKQKSVEEDIVEEEEGSSLSGTILGLHTLTLSHHLVSTGEKENSGGELVTGAIVLTELPPTPAATPILAGASQDTAGSEERHIPSTLEFAPTTKLQNEIKDLSEQYRAMKDQLEQISSLQQEVRSLRTAIDMQAGELERIRKETQTSYSLRNEILGLMKEEIKALRSIITRTNNPQGSTPFSTCTPFG